MTTMQNGTAETDTPPQHTMPGMFETTKPDEYPMRHKPVARYGDLWTTACERPTRWCFSFVPVRTVIEMCRPCPKCYPELAASTQDADETNSGERRQPSE